MHTKHNVTDEKQHATNIITLKPVLSVQQVLRPLFTKQGR